MIFIFVVDNGEKRSLGGSLRFLVLLPECLINKGKIVWTRK